jgi:hypothetical protein
MTHRRAANRCGGFTLAEVVASLGGLAVLIVAMGGAITLALRALPTRPGASALRIEDQWTAERIATELSTTKEVLSGGPSHLSVRTSDQTGDGADDTLEFRWAGSGTDPVQRRINAGTWATLVPEATRFLVEPLMEDGTIVACRIVVRSNGGSGVGQAWSVWPNRPAVSAPLAGDLALVSP